MEWNVIVTKVTAAQPLRKYKNSLKSLILSCF